MVRKHFYIIAYDIQRDSLRKKVAELLENYGYRANFSVFELMTTDKQLRFLERRLKKMINPDTDRVLVYRVYAACFEKCFAIGRPPEAPPMIRII